MQISKVLHKYDLQGGKPWLRGDKCPSLPPQRNPAMEQSCVVVTFFYGYLITQIPGGWMARSNGGKVVFGSGFIAVSTKFTTFSYAGAMRETVVSFPVSSLLYVYESDRGWPSMFYVAGTVGV